MLHRGAIRKIAACLVVLACAAWGAPKQRGPRAIGVVEWVNGRPRLVPVSIFLNNRFYDAGVYKGTPVPLALEPDTVYEGERTGLPQGLFTIERAERLRRAWIGFGSWRPRRPAGAATSGASFESEKSKSAPPDADQPPVLRRPGAPAKADEPKPAEPAQSAAAPVSARPQESEEEEDPNRPVLRRGKPAPAQREEPPEAAASSTPAAQELAAPPAKGAPPAQVMVAVSDATNRDSRAYTYKLIPEDHLRYTQQLSSMAAREILRYANSRPGPKPPGLPPRQGARTSAPPPKLTDAQFRALDLTLYSEPVLVFWARIPLETSGGGRPFEFYSALIARLDSNGELHKIFSAVTDTAHLDAIPRLELVDAVDAEGDGRGELLFRQTSDVGHSYVLYRVGRYNATELLRGEEVPN